VYRVEVLAQAERLLAEDRLRPFFLFQEADTLEVPIEELRAVDPELTTLENLNQPEDYFRALARAGFEAPSQIEALLIEKPDGDSKRTQHKTDG
jgi:molybdopterin-guanine dinucleotide biosynthesis protein A